MQVVVSLITGLLFGIGLILSGMTDPSKVKGFLDVTGNWDPSLAFVMGGAIAVGLVAFRMAGKRASSYLGAPMRLPSARHIDRRLVLGGFVFGIGWGLAGFCPGPALTSLGTGRIEALVFVATMLAGMAIYEFLDRMSAARARQAA